MKKEDIITNISEFASASPKSGHYKFLMGLGRCIPSNAAQVRVWMRCGCPLDVLGRPDVELISSIMEDAGMKADFKLTKSGAFARLVNVSTFLQALKLKYDVESKINTVEEAESKKNDRVKSQQIELLRKRYVDYPSKIDVTIYDSEFGCGHLNKLCEEDVRNAISLPDGARVTCTNVHVIIS